MRCVPERPPLLTFAVLMGCFVAGPLLGLGLGTRLAPQSDVAQVASVFAFPLAFFAGLLFWLGLGVVAVVVRALRSLMRGKLPSADVAASETLVPPGYASFIVFSTLASVAAGLLVGLLSDTSLTSALASYGASGSAYGVMLWKLAHHGYLPFPEPA